MKRKLILIMLLEKLVGNLGLGEFEGKGRSESIMSDYLF